MIYIPKTPEEHLFFAMWMKSRIDHFEPRNVQTVVVYRGDKIAAVAGYSNPHYNRVEMSIAADDPRWATRGNLLSVMAPVFMNPSNRGITAIVKRNNRRSRRLVEGVGFKNEGTFRQAGPNGENLILYGLLRDEYMALVKRFRPSVLEQAKELMNG